MTAPVAIDKYIGQATSDWSTLAAAALFLVVPILAVTGIVQQGYMKTFASASTG